MVLDGGLPHADAEPLAWEWLQTPGAAPGGASRRNGTSAQGPGPAGANHVDGLLLMPLQPAGDHRNGAMHDLRHSSEGKG
jgi:hypothetical protein